MVGIYGTIRTNDDFDKVKEHFFFTDNEYHTKYKGKSRSIYATFHNKEEAKSQPVEQGNVYLFIWGEICGYGDLKVYRSRKSVNLSFTDAEYCAELYKAHGIDFIKKLNSNFAGVIFDQESSKTYLFTDQIGSRSLYYNKGPNNSLLFSTSLQSIARHSNYEIKFDKGFLGPIVKEIERIK